MTRWDYDIRTLSNADRLPVLKKMGSEGWELVGIKEEPREGTPGLNDAATYITYWFMRPIDESVRVIEDWIKDLKEKKKQEKPLEPAPVLLGDAYGDSDRLRRELTKEDNPEILYLTVRMDDQIKVLAIMSNAGWYIKDVSKDRKVDGAFVTYTFTKRNDPKNRNSNLMYGAPDV